MEVGYDQWQLEVGYELDWKVVCWAGESKGISAGPVKTWQASTYGVPVSWYNQYTSGMSPDWLMKSSRHARRVCGSARHAPTAWTSAESARSGQGALTTCPKSLWLKRK